jgi:hypothetical protein
MVDGHRQTDREKLLDAFFEYLTANAIKKNKLWARVTAQTKHNNIS